MSKYHNVDEFVDAMRNLAKAYSERAEVIQLAEPSFDGETIFGLRIGSQNVDSTEAVLLIFGQHAREWVPPEAALAFMTDVLGARADNEGLIYGPQEYIHSQIRQLVDTINLIIVPCVNPDGRRYTQTPGKPERRMWRRNRNTTYDIKESCQGVDLNRNYDICFDMNKYFSPQSDVWTFTSDKPCFGDQVYQGPKAFSESESRNVRELMDRFKRVRYFVDVHGFKGEVYFPWSDDQNQTTNPAMNWQNQNYDGQRGVRNDAYQEYVSGADLARHAHLASELEGGIRAVRNQPYKVTQAFYLYPTAGGAQDYAWARHIVSNAPRVEAFSIEHFAQCALSTTCPSINGFQPTLSEKDDIVEELVSGLINFCLAVTPFTAPNLAIEDLGQESGGWRVDKHPRFVADLTGDGRADIVGFGDAGVYVALNNGDGSFQAPQLAVADFGQESGGWSVDRHPRFVADLTGDGSADIVAIGDAGVYVALNNGNGTFQAPQLAIADFGFESGGWRIEKHPRLLADLTGDGRADVVGFGDAGVYVALNNGDGSFQTPQLAVADFGQESGGWMIDKHPRTLADLTGDGRADVVGFGDAGVYVALNNGDGTFQAPQFVLDNFGIMAWGWMVDRHPRFLADLTSDGCADILGFANDGVFIARNNGDGTFQPAELVLENFGYLAGSWRVDRHPRMLADLTGDGKADIVGFGDAGAYVALNNGDGTFQPARFVVSDMGYEAGGWRIDKHPRLVADLTGDGRADLIGFGDQGVWTSFNALIL
jgi:murein tripeptide amidase MpaA